MSQPIQTQQPLAAPVPAPPTPTTKPAGSNFSTVAIVAAIVSLFIGGYVLAAIGLGMAIRAKMLGQKRAVLALCLTVAAIVLNVGVALLLA